MVNLNENRTTWNSEKNEIRNKNFINKNEIYKLNRNAEIKKKCINNKYRK